MTNVTKINANSFNVANDRITAFNGNVNLDLIGDGITYPGVIVDGNTFTGNVYDTTISSAFTTNFGIDPGNILIDGGAYVSTFSSHAPEELIPGRVFDSLDIKVFSNVAPSTNDYAFRLFDDMNGTHSFYRIANANVTTLTSNLSMTDSNIHVVNASILPQPNANLAIPGVVFIGGEKITYYKNYSYQTAWQANVILPVDTVITYNGNIYVTTGNVYDSTFANISSKVNLIGNISTFGNVLGQIRRGVDGTGTPATHSANLRVVDASIQQVIPNANIANVSVAAGTSYTVTANISYNLPLAGYPYLSANIGDYITQTCTANSAVVANLRVLGTVNGATPWTANLVVSPGTVLSYSNQFYVTTGNVYAQYFANILANVTTANANAYSTTSIPVIFVSGNLVSTANTVQINGQTVGNVTTRTPTKLGTITSTGNVVITSNSYVAQTQDWYTPGAGTATNGTGLINSTTAQATFLKQSPGYTP